MSNDSTGRLLLETLRMAVRKNKELAAQVKQLTSHVDQLSQRLKIIEDRLGPGA